jgi:5-formyltetrahydrofolate cyclo-ligase
MNKAALRLKHQDRRNALDPGLIEAASFRIQEKLWPKLKDAQSIGIYVSMAREVQTIAVIQQLLVSGKIVCVPKIVKHHMIFVQVHAFSELERSPYGILEPRSNEPYQGQIEVQVIPMLAYNEGLFRLGYGKGYYDTYLADFKGFKLGICFKEDREPLLEETQNDVACDEILTQD